MPQDNAPEVERIRRQDQQKADRDRNLGDWVKKVWAHFDGHGTVIQRLRKAVTLCDMVDRRGPNLKRDEELMVQQLLNGWGPGKTVKNFGWLAENEGHHATKPTQR